ncbi:hypothetical protein FRD01_07520 [Microvenator marinus]|uniref:Uncharacterized protein n=1 Tax=Microvenator marinus TaxID=2600177 RepID=A0A5B8XPC9_9DELT|nr:hypothetical protein [Microvenator marinus]QED27091.1 hypothetical protein FRD01_07520 [Microvenator marinus]
MNRVGENRADALWDTGSPDRVEELRKAVINESGGLQESHLANVVGELLARLDSLAESPSTLTPAPPFRGGSPPDSREMTAILQRLPGQVDSLKQGLDSAGAHRVDRMVDVLKFYGALKHELMSRAEKS